MFKPGYFRFRLPMYIAALFVPAGAVLFVADLTLTIDLSGSIREINDQLVAFGAAFVDNFAGVLTAVVLPLIVLAFISAEVRCRAVNAVEPEPEEEKTEKQEPEQKTTWKTSTNAIPAPVGAYDLTPQPAPTESASKEVVIRNPATPAAATEKVESPKACPFLGLHLLFVVISSWVMAFTLIAVSL